MPDNKTTTTLANDAWGIIRYAPGSGRFPDEDAAAFDGWYASRADATALAEEWVKHHPRWFVAVVCQADAWFGGGDFATVDHLPLTYRERKFAEGVNP